jgi:hypothetical protein
MAKIHKFDKVYPNDRPFFIYQNIRVAGRLKPEVSDFIDFLLQKKPKRISNPLK